MNILHTTIERVVITGETLYEWNEAYAWMASNGYTVRESGGQEKWFIKAERPHAGAPAIMEAIEGRIPE